MQKKTLTTLLLALALIGISTLAFNVHPAKATSFPVHNIDTGEDFLTIQEAINVWTTLDGHTILVDAGIYYENVIVHKSLTLIGEDSSNTVVDGNEVGTVIQISAHNVTVSQFTIQNSGYKEGNVPYTPDQDYSSGIQVLDYLPIENTTIANNILTGNGYGIFSMDANHTTILNNVCVNNKARGIFITLESYDILKNNTMINNPLNFGVGGFLVEHFLHDIDTSNTVNQKPIYYLLNQHDREVPADGGYIAIVNSTNIVARDLTLTNNVHGVRMVFTTDSIVENVTVSDNLDGIYLTHSANNTVTGSRLINNIDYGILLHFNSSDNVIHENNIISNEYGVTTYRWSTQNRIYHNNIIDNANQAYSHPSLTNVWDDGYPSGGNYWSDYSIRYPSIEDAYKGENQDILGSDGIWDSPYVISMEDQDNYPLVEPWPPTPPIIAAMDIAPDTLNLKSCGEWISTYIELPEGYSVSDIDIPTIQINGTIAIDSSAPTQIEDYDLDGVPDLMVKFDRASIIEWLGAVDYSEDVGKSYLATVTITGKALDMTFEGSDTIKVLCK